MTKTEPTIEDLIEDLVLAHRQDDFKRAIQAHQNQAVKEATSLAMQYMTPERAEDYQNRLHGTFQNDPRLQANHKGAEEHE